MATTREPLVNFYELSGPQSWSPACWNTRYALNFKGIPFKTIKLSYPAIKPKCEELLGDLTGLEATVPIIEILGDNHKALNDSIPIAELLNERFTEADGFRHLEGLDNIREYEKQCSIHERALGRWILNDVYENSLDKEDGSREYFKSTREARLKCPLPDIMEKLGGGEEASLQKIRENWLPLKERMKNEDGTSEPTYLDFYDAGNVKWTQCASLEKYEKLMNLYGDDTFVKLMKKVEKYSA
ncbi:glutathione s-transferase [Phlyctema vagabunda]|uniref:Glutathione s-transferase n=1 Tax=Phlyctema vagabunda TaxID=108571 RepID=A0ABR4PB80_9HELO